MERRTALWIVAALVIGLLVGTVGISAVAGSLRRASQAGQSAAASPTADGALRLTLNSKNVFRVYGADSYQTAVAVSQLIYPGARTDAHPDAQPGVVILAPAGFGADPFYAEALPAAGLVHHPRNGPVLFTAPDSLNPDTAAEIQRLSPSGGTDFPQVFVIGRVSAGVEDEVRALGFRTERLAGNSPEETAAIIDERLGRPTNVILVSADDPSHALPAPAWIAHMMDSSILLTGRDRLSDVTLRALRTRGGPFDVYILGPESQISAEVERQLVAESGARDVVRVAGADPAETAVSFAQFRSGAFGWGNASGVHNFYLVAPGRWSDAVAGALTAHLGGHGPLLVAGPENSLPTATRRYIESVRPTFANEDPTQARPIRGYLIASPDVISFDQQAEVDWLAESVPAGGAMPGMHEMPGTPSPDGEHEMPGTPGPGGGHEMPGTH